MPKGPQPGHRRTSQQPAQPKGSRLLDSIPGVTAMVMGAGVTHGEDRHQGHAAGQETGRTLGGRVLLEHPEDLGRVKDGGTPGSIWRWPLVRKLSNRTGILWGALAQQDLGAPSVKPTRLLGNLSCALHWLHLGPPRFDARGRYLGPLPPRWNSIDPAFVATVNSEASTS